MFKLVLHKKFCWWTLVNESHLFPKKPCPLIIYRQTRVSTYDSDTSFFYFPGQQHYLSIKVYQEVNQLYRQLTQVQRAQDGNSWNILYREKKKSSFKENNLIIFQPLQLQRGLPISLSRPLGCSLIYNIIVKGLLLTSISKQDL